MENKPFDRLETYLEQFIEGVFANIFGKRVRAQDVALRLSRAMQDGCKPARPGDSRPIAPDRYIIQANPRVQAYLLDRHPDILITLAQHLVDLATQCDFRLENAPAIKVLANHNLDTGTLHITAEHSSQDASSTAAMQAVKLPIAEKPANAQLIINDHQIIHLQDDTLNIGRHPENDIVINDPSVSRRHLQIRLRHGAYMVFDVNSRTGMLVNGTPSREHRLNSGDIIRIGSTQIIYLHDQADDDTFDIEATTPYEL
jgi:hypothetical protein